MNKIDVKKLSYSLLLTFSVAYMGGVATYPATSSWYLAIAKPTWTPPSWLFGPVWTILYFLMAISFYLAWKKGFKKKNDPALLSYLTQLFLNLLWSVIFFGFGQFWLAYIEILLLLLFIFLTIKSFRRISVLASVLLVPYLLWVSFASFLNLAVAFLN